MEYAITHPRAAELAQQHRRPAPTAPPLPVHIRWMIRRDMPNVLAIESACFDPLSAWTEDDFIRALRHRNCIGMVAVTEAGTDNETLVGYMLYELHKDSLRLINFAADPRHPRCGIGRAMIDKLKGKLSAQRRRFISLEVREKNLPAQLFFKACGFRAVRTLRSFYAHCDWDGEWREEDAYAMRFDYGSDGDGLW